MCQPCFDVAIAPHNETKEAMLQSRSSRPHKWTAATSIVTTVALVLASCSAGGRNDSTSQVAKGDPTNGNPQSPGQTQTETSVTHMDIYVTKNIGDSPDVIGNFLLIGAGGLAVVGAAVWGGKTLWRRHVNARLAKQAAQSLEGGKTPSVTQVDVKPVTNTSAVDEILNGRQRVIDAVKEVFERSKQLRLPESKAQELALEKLKELTQTEPEASEILIEFEQQECEQSFMKRLEQLDGSSGGNQLPPAGGSLQFTGTLNSAGKRFHSFLNPSTGDLLFHRVL